MANKPPTVISITGSPPILPSLDNSSQDQNGHPRDLENQSTHLSLNPYTASSTSLLSPSTPLLPLHSISHLYRPNREGNQEDEEDEEENEGDAGQRTGGWRSATRFFSQGEYSEEDHVGGRRRSRKGGKRKISHRSAHVKILRHGWCLALILGEYAVYWAMIRRCQWPEDPTWDLDPDTIKDRYRIAIIADPQLTDWYSYKQSGVLLALVQAYTDIYMRRSFHRLHNSLRPDAVFFLGDLLDGGRGSSQEVFEKNRDRFLERVFETQSSAWNTRPVVMDDDNVRRHPEQQQKGTEEKDTLDITGQYRLVTQIPQGAEERERIKGEGKSLRLYAAGNHDVGFGDDLVRASMKRFKAEFGSVNYEVQVGNHTLVVLDTLALSSDVESIREEAQAFLDKMEREPKALPRILFTHVPLFRTDTTSCGEARESSQLILNRGGYQYWNMVQPNLSAEILRKIQPEMVFSGDDHDWCEIGHSLDHRVTPEVTVRTFSFAQGVQQPAFVMLSLYHPIAAGLDTGVAAAEVGGVGGGSNAATGATFVYEECMLPRQLMIYFIYIGLFVFSLNWIMIQRFRWMMQAPSLPSASASAIHLTSTSPGHGFGDGEEGHLLQDAEQGNDQEMAYQSEHAVPFWTVQKASPFPLISSTFWKFVGWDLWNVIRVVIPFYGVLFVLSWIQ